MLSIYAAWCQIRGARRAASRPAEVEPLLITRVEPRVVNAGAR